jgi:hypothetical protein
MGVLSTSANARWLRALVLCSLLVHSRGLSCCDVENYERIEAENQTYFGIPAVMYRATFPNNTQRCPLGTQCIPCTAPDTKSVNLADGASYFELFQPFKRFGHSALHVNFPCDSGS